MTDDELVTAIINGSERIWRFTAQEQSGSSDIADRFLWLAILRAERELAESVFGTMPSGSSSASGGASTPHRFLKSLSQPLPSTFDGLIGEIGRYADRGQESIVCDSGDGFVNKLRPMKPSILSGYLAPLANIVYHNYLFPHERYTLETIYESNDEKYYLVLRQRRVEIALKNGYPVKPTVTQIRDAVAALGVGLVEYSGDEDEIGSTDSTDSADTGIKLRFYNSDYFISDLQPGRNTVIEADTGRICFIDPRIMLNDPAGPITHVSKFGKRSEDLPGQIFSNMPQ